MDVLVTTQNAFVRLNALRLCSNFTKVHLLLQFTKFIGTPGMGGSKWMQQKSDR